MESRDTITPFLKWAGGKRWFVYAYSDLLPSSFNRYIEPFLGSGVVYFHLQPRRAVLADVNSELINTYTAIRDRPDLIKRYLADHQLKHSKRHYYAVRDSRTFSPFTGAARTIYLNRTGWNALYRVNLNGIFNVPQGSKSSVMLPTDDFDRVSQILKRAKLLASDFESVIDNARKNDFIFVDPPYTVNHNLNGFLKYNEKIFSWDDQVRLRDSIDDAVRRGVKVLMTNADHESIRELYDDFELVSLERSSVIAASTQHRGVQTELAIRCWN